MKFGVAFALQNYTDWDRFFALERGEEVGPPAVSDYRIWTEQVALADLVEPLGFDSLWSMEQHAAPYLMVCDPTQFLTYFAARTKHIRLGTMVVVLPWHDAIRVCEDVSVLDIVSGGRFILGVGRGVAKIEFDAFRVDMNQTRDLLIDNIKAIRMGLEEGYIELDGAVVKQPRALTDDDFVVKRGLGAGDRIGAARRYQAGLWRDDEAGELVAGLEWERGRLTLRAGSNYVVLW